MTNSITITGRLPFDPELKFANSGTAYCAISVPDQKRKRDANGNWEDASATTWFRATIFNEAAEMLASNAHKGDEVTVTGRLITREYEKDGETRQSLEVDFATVAWHGRKKERNQGQQQSGSWGQQPAQSAPAQGGGWTQSSQGGGSNGYDEPPF